MSLAWATVAIIVLLLPGILFLIGLFSRERYSRDAAFQSPVIPLAFAIAVALSIHGIYYAFLDPWLCGKHIPCINMTYVLAALQISDTKAIPMPNVAENLSANRQVIFLYLVLTTTIGFFIGRLYSRGVVAGILPSFCQHAWIRDLIKEEHGTLIWANVLTRIEHEGQILMYRGAVKEFFATSDGTVKYLILSRSTRYYMKMDKASPKTSAPEEWMRIGESSRAARTGPRSSEALISSSLLIEGGDISNVLFERRRSPKPELDLDTVIAQVRARMGEQAAAEELGSE